MFAHKSRTKLYQKSELYDNHPAIVNMDMGGIQYGNMTLTKYSKADDVNSLIFNLKSAVVGEDLSQLVSANSFLNPQ